MSEQDTIFVRTDYVPKRHLNILTPNKLYKTFIKECLYKEPYNAASLISDNGKELNILIGTTCAFLDEKRWQIVDPFEALVEQAAHENP